MRIPTELAEAAAGLHLWLPEAVGLWGLANCAVISSEDQALLVDTPYTTGLTATLAEAAGRVLPSGAAITRIVNTHPNGDHTFGNAYFTGAEIISTDTNLERLCSEPTPRQTHALVRESDPDEPMGWYARKHFGRYDYTGLEVVPPTTTFSGTHTLKVGSTEVRLIEAGPAHTAGDLIVHLPQQRVVLAGDVLFVDDHPVHWQGPLGGVIRASERILALDPEVVVPGHGPVVGPAEVRSYIAYLRELEGMVHERYAKGMEAYEAASEILAADFHPHLGIPERIVILTAIEYRHLDGGGGSVPDTIGLLGGAARWAFEQDALLVPRPPEGAVDAVARSRS
ncbi:MBL fold metallo-hydrolase [Streptomyces sp. NPDC059009]|uniref:MBL fold metallo-hydrolase n=1 Tax=Streptomyces sp. NPDC059009 TaxID=3346694 RepID=UPI0036860727